MGMYSKMRTGRRVPEAQQRVAKTQNVGDIRMGGFYGGGVHSEVRLDPPHLPIPSSKGGHGNSLTQPRERVC